MDKLRILYGTWTLPCPRWTSRQRGNSQGLVLATPIMARR